MMTLKKPKMAQVGGVARDRTDDLTLAKQALSQLSYGPQLHASRNAAKPLPP